MSAVVTIPSPVHRGTDEVGVSKGNGYTIDSDGLLHVKTGPWGECIAVFKEWEYVVINPDRGPNGRFVKKD